MTSWFHTVKGQYRIADKFIGLDFSRLFLDPIDAETTLVHETVHGIIATMDFGQGTQTVIYAGEHIVTLNKTEQIQVITHLVKAQDFVQEGMATLMQVQRRSKITSKKEAIEWAKKNLPLDYLERFNKLKFVFKMSQKDRARFTSKISQLAMETGFRKYFVEGDLLQSLAVFEDYLQGDNAPNNRLIKLIDYVSDNHWVLSRSVEEIAQRSGVTYHPFVTKQEAANFLTYVASKTTQPRKFTSDEIGETLDGSEAALSIAENAVIGNMNINLTQTSEPLFKHEDLLHYSDVIEAIMLFKHNVKEYNDFFELVTGEIPDINIAAFRPTGEKYTSAMSNNQAANLFGEQFKHVTLVAKNDSYSLQANKLNYTEGTRPLDIVIYNNIKILQDDLRKHAETNPDAKIKFFHAGTTVDHPFQIFIVQVGDIKTLHLVNTYGKSGISKLLAEFKGAISPFTPEEMIDRKKHINDVMSIWMGASWQVDWIETMINGKQLILR